MSEILVPIICEGKASLYTVEANLKTGGAKSIDICNKIKGQGFEGIDCIIDKIHNFFGKEINISIGLRDIETQKMLKAGSISMSTQSITLGILAKVIELEEKRLLKSTYDYIILTGNYNDGKFISVLDIEKKLEIVKTLETISKRRSLFLYISEKEIIKSGLYNDNLQIEYLPTNIDYYELDDRIFIENFDDKQKEIIEEIAIDKSNEFIETEIFRTLKTDLNKGLCSGYVLVGRSNSGKSVITYNLCKYLMRKKKVYVPVWVTLNNSKLQEILKSEHISTTANKDETTVEKLKQYIESLLLYEFDLKLSYALVIDNLELDYCDELISAIKLLIQEKKFIKYIFITSWWTCNNEKSLKSLEIRKKELAEINNSDFKGILNSVIYSQFTTKLQLLTPEEKKELADVLYEELKYSPGEIALTLSSLQNISFQDLISKLKEDSKKPNDKRNYFLNLKFSQLGLFSQIVIYAYLSLYCNFDEEDSLQPEDITIDDVKSRVCEVGLINQGLITDESISKALKQIKNNYLFEEIGSNKYIIKSDTIRFLLFAVNDETVVNQLVTEYISDITLINITILYDWFDEFSFLMESDYNLCKEALIEICKSKNAKIEYLEFLKHLNVNFNEKDEEGWAAIHYAAWKNSSLTIIKFLCENCNVDLRRCSNDNKNILHFAATNDNLEVFQYIFSLGVFDINTCDQDKWTPLHYAARFTNNIDVIKFIISKGADVLAETKYNQIPFHLAALNTNESIILYFLKNKKLSKAKNATDDTGETPICYAAKINTNLQVIKYCFEFGCDYTNLNNEKENLFHLSAQNENPEVIKYLFENMNLDEYYNKDNTDLSPLGSAVFAGKNVEIVKLFHEKGFNFSELDENHVNLLQISLYNSNIEIFKYLLSLNIFDINHEDTNGNTIVHYAVEYCSNDKIIMELRKLKCDFLKRNLKGQSALHLAAKNPEDKILKKIINYHLYSDINETDSNEYSAIHYACMSGNEESIDILLHCGANLKQLGPADINCLMLCARENNIRVLQYLINSGFFTMEEINQADKDGESVLCYAVASNDNPEMIDFLIEHGASIDVIDNNRFRLLHYAVRSNTNLDMIKYMFNIGLFGHYNIDIPDSTGQTPLAYAIRYNPNLDIAKYLIDEKNANTRLKIDRQEFSYLHCATLNPNPQVLEYVIKNKKNFFDDISEADNIGNNAFSDAAQYAQSIEIFELLYKAKCTPRINKNGDNILHLILEELDQGIFEADSEYAKRIEIAEKKIRFIINHNLCDINEYNGNGVPFIHLALLYPFNKKFLKELLEIGDLDKLTTDGESIQQMACQFGSFELINFLIENGYIIKETLSIQDNMGWTPLLLALRFNEDVAVINKLFELDPDITVMTNYKIGLLEAASFNSNIQILDLVLNKIGNNEINLGRQDGVRPIHYACEDNSNPEILMRLQEYGADISLTSTDGRTILHYAALNENVDIIKTVVEKLTFEDIFKKDDYGATALFYAADKNNYDVFEYLLKLGLSPYDTNKNGLMAIDFVDTAYKAKYEALLKALYF